jgi:hypothetical protein
LEYEAAPLAAGAAGKLQYTVDGANAVITGCATDAADADVEGELAEIAGAGYTITGIGNGAFRNCAQLTSFATLTSLGSIGNEAFRGCTSLAEVRLPEGLKTIGYSAFSGTKLTEITIPKNVTGMSQALVGAGDLRAVTFADGMAKIPVNALLNTSQVTTVVIPTSIETIGNYAFDGCSQLTHIIDGSHTNLTGIGNYAFRNCAGLTEISLPERLTTIS